MKMFTRQESVAQHAPASVNGHQNGSGAIELEKVRVGFDHEHAPILDNFNLRVEDGEIVSLLGPSGVGKSTALRVIAGFERVIEGKVTLGGELVGSPTVHLPPHKRALGLVFQSYALFPHLSVAQNVEFGLDGMDDRQKRFRVAEILDMCGIAQHAERGVHDLSGGEQQRVAIARAIAPDSVAVLLDEPIQQSRPDSRCATPPAGS